MRNLVNTRDEDMLKEYVANGVTTPVIALLPVYLLPLYGGFNIIWKLFDSGFIAPIQAFIYSFLTILYFGFAVAEEH